MQETHANELLTKDEAAAVLRVSKVTVSRLIAAGRLASYKVGRRVFITRRHIDDLLRRSEKNAEEAR